MRYIYHTHTLHHKLCLIHVPSYCYMIVNTHVLFGGLMCMESKLYIRKMFLFVLCVCVCLIICFALFRNIVTATLGLVCLV